MKSSKLVSRLTASVLTGGLCLTTIGVGSTLAAPHSRPAASGRTFSLGYQELFSELPELVAQDQGYLRQAGIGQLNLVPFTSLPAMLSAVEQGQISAAVQTPSAVVAFNLHTSGSPLRFFLPQQVMNLVYTARNGSGIPVTTKSNNWEKTVRAWKGKTIGVPAIGGLLDLVSRFLGSAAGITPNKDFVITVSGTGPAEVAALQNGAVNVVVGDDYGAAAVTSAHLGYNVLDFGKGQGPGVLKGTIESGIFAPISQLKSQPGLYGAFSRAIERAVKFMQLKSSRIAVVRTLERHLGANPTLAKLLATYVGDFKATLSPSIVNRTLRGLSRANALPVGTSPTYSDVVYTLPGK